MQTQASWEARKRTSRKNLLTDEASYKCPSSSTAARHFPVAHLKRRAVRSCSSSPRVNGRAAVRDAVAPSDSARFVAHRKARSTPGPGPLVSLGRRFVRTFVVSALSLPRRREPPRHVSIVLGIICPTLSRAVPPVVLDSHIDAAVDNELHRLVGSGEDQVM